jgi:apolipoprotein N-acyltransferase
MKLLSSWGATEYLRLLVVLGFAWVVMVGFLRWRKKRDEQELLPFLLSVGAGAASLTILIFGNS